MPVPDPLGTLLQGFESLLLDYMVTGSVASILYGEPRLTNDVDLVVRLSRQDGERLARVFPAAEFYVPPAETIAEEAGRSRHGHFNVIHLDSTFRADVYVAGDDPLHRWALPLKHRIRAGDTEFWVAPPEYVILRKLEYFRESGQSKHLRDIRAMLAVSGDGIDQALITTKAVELGLEREWAQGREAGLEG